MDLKYLVPLMIALVVGFTGCTRHHMDVGRPEPRPLGKGFATYRPPHRLPSAASASVEAEEPTGFITLRQALALALMKNPQLAAFSWNVRVG